MTSIEEFYNSFQNKIRTEQVGGQGGEQEQIFTDIVLDLLEDSGETENTMLSYHENELNTKNQRKINAFAISDNNETLDLFISIFRNTESIENISKQQIKKAYTQITNLFTKILNPSFSVKIDEAEDLNFLLESLHHDEDVKKKLMRVNAYILTDGRYKVNMKSTIESKNIGGYTVNFRVIDIQEIYKLESDSQLCIEIDFEKIGQALPYVSVQTGATEYQSYIAIMPGNMLAKLYEVHGARLLEQNVRSFLQFTGNINKGIRNTIKKEPHLFLAYNNGIAATADSIITDKGNKTIKKVTNFQIVNGGQTTASIFHTKKQDKADLSQVYVQVKLNVISKDIDYSDFVSRVSRYTNTQNKVSNADFTANNPFLVELEKASRRCGNPKLGVNKNYWFFERARGQYKSLRQKDANTSAERRAFDIRYPKSQLFTKDMLAKSINSYSGVIEDGKVVIGPHVVVKGSDKNYTQFIVRCVPTVCNKAYFEDCVAKIILFKEAVKRYGKSPKSIGKIRFIIVPYAISLLSYLTEGKLNLRKIWLEQQVSPKLSEMLYTIMKALDDFVMEVSPNNLISEWAKKEECWNKVKAHNWTDFIKLDSIYEDLMSNQEFDERIKLLQVQESNQADYEEKFQKIKLVQWNDIREWGVNENAFDIRLVAMLRHLTAAPLSYPLSSKDYEKVLEIYKIVEEKEPTLLCD